MNGKSYALFLMFVCVGITVCNLLDIAGILVVGVKYHVLFTILVWFCAVLMLCVSVFCADATSRDKFNFISKVFGTQQISVMMSVVWLVPFMMSFINDMYFASAGVAIFIILFEIYRSIHNLTVKD